MSKSHFEITRTDDAGIPVLHLSGILDENSDLSLLRTGDGRELKLDLSQIRRINSFGVRAWMEAMRQIPSHRRVRFIRCSPPVVDQCNMVIGFVGPAEIESFQAPLICEECDEQKNELFQTAQCLTLGGRLPPVPCPSCGNPMAIDDLEEHYLYFLHRQLEALRS